MPGIPTRACMSKLSDWENSSEVAACDGYTRNAVSLRAPCTMTLNSGAPDAWKKHGLLMEGKNNEGKDK